MGENSENNKRLAKNTLLLYGRMLLIMVVSLYTSRVILEALGVEDYGIYNVVGGVVSMFSMLSGSFSAAISRFITFELGAGNMDRLGRIFSSAVTIQIIFCVVVLLLAETAGLWFLHHKMVIAPERMGAASWVFQLSVATFCINLLSVPYNACIVAHERMGAFAAVGIVEAAGKLAIAFLIKASPMDRLVFYALLMCLLAAGIRVLYSVYCRRHFPECRFTFSVDRPVLKQMFSFAGWNAIGSASAVLRVQGGNVLLNMFFGAVVNAANGIASQVSHAVTSFVQNFMTALNPQITKNYAAGNLDYTLRLCFQGSRLSFYIILLLALPVIISAEYVLGIWLHTVPEYTVLFVQMALVFAMSEAVSSPLITLMLATGRIRNYQIVVGGLALLNVPLTYLFFRLGFHPVAVYCVAVFISQCCMVARLVMLRGMVGLDVSGFFRQVYVNVASVSIVCFALAFAADRYFISMSFDGFARFLLTSLLCIFATAVSVLYIGASKDERAFVYARVRKAVKKIR